MYKYRFTIISAVNDRNVLKQNLLSSSAIYRGNGVQIIIKEGFSSASLAYNSAISEAEGDILVFAHQDVYLPKRWLENVSSMIYSLEATGMPWGVLGSFGSRRGVIGGIGMVFTTGRGLHGNAINSAEPVETLDEIVLIIRKSSSLKFDPGLPYFHLYGADLCLTARNRGLINYAIPAFCVHNTNELIKLPMEYYSCYGYIKKKWSEYLPIHTSCIKIDRFDVERRERRIKELINEVLNRKKIPLKRVKDPRLIVAESTDYVWQSAKTI